MPRDTLGDIPVLTPRGDLDLTSARGLASQLGELAGTAGNAVLDLSEVAFMDSVGLAVVLKAVNRFRRQDKRLLVVAPPEGNVVRVIDLAGARGRVTVTGTRDEALAQAGRTR
jgi:anti-anti-sigma factor